MFDLYEVVANVQYANELVNYVVTFEKSSISKRVQNVKYFIDGEEYELDDLWDGADIRQLKDMVHNYEKFAYTVKEC